MTNRQIVLTRLPQGDDKLTVEHFTLAQGERPSPREGEVLLKARYVSLDAANRAWMQGASYRAGLNPGDVMAGQALAEVLESRVAHLTAGDLVLADTGWQDYAVLAAQDLRKLPKLVPETYLLSVYGIAGLTAYFGLLECGHPQPGETVVVSAAAGSVGTLAGQIAKIRGARVVGIAGGEEKGRWLLDELGFDAVADHKAADFKQQLRNALPHGIDVYFDNVGGSILEACLSRMNTFGRIICCGAVSQYDGAPSLQGTRGVPVQVIIKRLTMRGFLVWDFAEQNEKALADLRTWIEDGRLKVPEDIVEGLQNLPRALVGLLQGENRGKRMVRV